MDKVQGFRFHWQDSALTLSTDVPEVARTVGRLLALPTLPWSTTGGQEPDLTVRRLGDNHWICEWATATQYFECWEDLVLQVVSRLGGHFLRHTENLVLHAGACVVDGQAVLFSGPSRIGKSSLAVAAWLAGREVIVDDWLAVDPDRHTAFVFPKALKPRIDERLFPAHLAGQLPADHCLVGRINNEYRLVVGRGLPRMADYAGVYPIARLYLLERAAGDASRVEQEIDRTAALQSLVPQIVMTARRTVLDGIRVLGALLERKSVYRLWVGEHDLARAVDLMLG